MIADLNRSSVTVKKFRADVKKKAENAADEIESTIKNTGASEETMALTRAKIMGIVS